MRRLFSDIKPHPVRRLFADITTTIAPVAPTPYQRYLSGFSCNPVNKSSAGMSWLDLGEPSFAPPEYHGSVFRAWAAKFFHQQRWRALPHQSVDDLLQNAYFKYVRCVQLYVYERRRECDGPRQLMIYFKTACHNMLTDESRIKQRRPEMFRMLPFDTTNEIDCGLQLDNSLVVATEASNLAFEV